jgi:hypothetical protein
MYHVIIEDFENNLMFSKYQSSYLHDASDFAENFVQEYVKNKMGENAKNILKDIKKRANTLPPGFCGVKSKKSIYPKFTVMFCQKFYWSSFIKKIFKISVVRINIRLKEKVRKSLMLLGWQDIFNECLWQLKDYKKNIRKSFMSLSNKCLFDRCLDELKEKYEESLHDE